MATVALSRLRAMLAQAMGVYVSSSLTSIGGAGGANIVDTAIQRYDSALLINKWLYLTSGAISGQSQRISTISGSTITPVVAFTAQVASGVTYEILSYDPAVYNNAIGEAIRTLQQPSMLHRIPRLYLPVRDETLIVDNLLTNSSFENFSTTFTGWTNILTPTLAQSSTIRVHGTYAANIVASGGTEGIEQDIKDVPDIDKMVGKTLHVRGWVYAAVASAVRLRVTFDGSTYTNGPWQGSVNAWEGPSVHRIAVAIPSALTEMTVSCEVTDTNVGRFDLVVAWVDPISQYTLPTTFYPNGPHRIYQQVYEDRPEGPYVPLSGYATPGQVLRLEGVGRLTVPTTDSGTSEIDETQAELIVAQAAAYFFRTLANYDFGNREMHRADQAMWQQTADGMRGMGGQGAHERTYWWVSPTDTRLLILAR